MHHHNRSLPSCPGALLAALEGQVSPQAGLPLHAHNISSNKRQLSMDGSLSGEAQRSCMNVCQEPTKSSVHLPQHDHNNLSTPHLITKSTSSIRLHHEPEAQQQYQAERSAGGYNLLERKCEGMIGHGGGGCGRVHLLVQVQL